MNEDNENMPQPLSKVNPNASIIISAAGTRLLSERPGLAILVSEAINSWSQVESFQLNLFVKMFGGNESLAAKIYLSQDTRNAKSKALTVAINTIADKKLKLLILAINKLSKSSQSARDKLAHHVWGISKDLPDAILLMDPVDVLDYQLDRNKIKVYRKKDLVNIIETNDRLCGYYLHILYILNNHPANEGGQLYDEISNQPEVKAILDHQALQAQTPPEE